MRRANRYQDIRVFESALFGRGPESAGLAMPGIGIFVGLGTYSSCGDSYLMRHEFGHILQARQIGLFRFYLLIGLRSLASAMTDGFGKGHQHYWTESWANHIAREFFDDPCWPLTQYPCKDLDSQRKNQLWI